MSMNTKIYTLRKNGRAYQDTDLNTPLLCRTCKTQYKTLGIYSLICENGHVRELKHDGTEAMIQID